MVVRKRNRIAKGLFVFILILGLNLGATEYQPWFGNTLEFEFRTAYSFQTYSRVDTAAGSCSVSADDHFLNLSLGITPLSAWNGELELLLAHTSSQGFELAHGRATARYLWFDDVVGDPMSMSTGLSLTVPSEGSQEDLSTPYHGDVEAELHVTVGKEFCEGRYWEERIWALAAVGIANVGSPWVRLDLHFGKNYQDVNRWKLFLHSLWGLGDRCLVLSDKFQSYGSIDHRSVDVGVGYSRLIEYCGRINIEYAYRLYARSYPEHVHVVTLEFLFPFSL